jgi:hypothetical protein
MKRLNPLFVLGLGPAAGLCLASASVLASLFASAVVSAVAPGVASADPALVTQTRTVSAFHAVDLAGTLEVEVTVGKPASVEVTGDADLVDKVRTTVKDGVLVISTPDLHHIGHRDSHLRAIVSAPDLSSLALSGTGTMKATGVANERLAITLPGTGEIKVTGSTGTLQVTLDGTGDVSAKALAARDAVVALGGTGDARLRATRSLDARISGTGSIHVEGSPTQIKKSVSGLGSIHVR